MTQNKCKYFILLILLTALQTLSAQKKESKFHFYGGFGLNFSGNSFQVSVQPGLLYDANKIFKVGAGVQYAYGTNSGNVIGTNYSYHILGFNFLSLAYPINEIEISAEFEDLYVMQKLNNTSSEYWSPALFAGVGYHFGNVAVGFKYDFLHKNGKSVYQDAFMPYIRIYF
jgi:hypothetical protein